MNESQIALQDATATELSLVKNTGISNLQQLEMYWKIAEKAHQSGLTKANTIFDAFFIIGYGQELGISPFASLRTIYSVNGVPTCSGEMMLGLIRRSGLLTSNKIEELTNNQSEYLGAKCTMKRKDTGEDLSITFTLKDAETAGLKNKQVWKSYPKNMCRWRAVSNVAKLLFGDVIGGLYTFEEIANDNQQIDESGAPVGEIIQYKIASEPPKNGDLESPERIALEAEIKVKAEKELLDKLKADAVLRMGDYYPNVNELKGMMKNYAQEFGTDPMQDGFQTVTANLIKWKDARRDPADNEIPMDIRKKLVGDECSVVSINFPDGQAVGREIYWEALVEVKETASNAPIRLYEEHLEIIADLLKSPKDELKSLLVDNSLDVSEKRLVIIPDWHKQGLRMESAFIEVTTSSPQKMLTDEQVKLNNEVKAKTDLLKELEINPNIRREGYYPKYKDLVDTMKNYTELFKTDPMQDGILKVIKNLKTHKKPAQESPQQPHASQTNAGDIRTQIQEDSEIRKRYKNKDKDEVDIFAIAGAMRQLGDDDALKRLGFDKVKETLINRVRSSEKAES